MGIDASVVPTKVEGNKRKLESDGPSSKRQKTYVGAGFNGAQDDNNDADLTLEKRGRVPLLPKDCKILLLDIEGCTTSISFVKDVLFPYVLENIESYLSSLEIGELQTILSALQKDIQVVQTMVKLDVKATGLKGLQGKMWKSGYASGELKGHVYQDFPFLLNWCKENGVQVNIYSSGSIGAQKLLFSKSIVGDLCPHFHAHFDTTSGGKKESQSYLNIAKDLGVSPSEICFVSDAEAELVAAREAGVGYVVMSVRPGNAVMTPVGYEFPRVFSLMQLCGY